MAATLLVGWLLTACQSDEPSRGRSAADRALDGYTRSVREADRKARLSREWHEAHPAGRTGVR